MPRFSALRFDAQADSHDERTGIPAAQCLEVARAVASLCGAAPGDRLLDLGAGTGLPGAWFPEAGFRTLGLDASAPMLARFAAREGAGALDLVRADADRPWPLADATVAVVFSARAAHLLDASHLVAEVGRVGRPGAALVLGRVEREDGGPRQQLRDQMRRCLRERGFEPRDARKQHRELLDALCRRGARPLAETLAARWPARHSAEGVIQAWTRTGGLGGCELEPGVKAEILGELRDWARQHLESPQAPVVSEERFRLEGVRLATP